MVRINPLLLALLIAVIGIAAPIAIVLLLAKQQGIESEKTRATGYAAEALEKSSTTFQLFMDLEKHLSPMIVGQPCDRENINQMEYAALESREIKALGYVQGDQLLCSSLNIQDRVFELGKVDYAGKLDPTVKIRTDVYIPRLGDLEFTVLQKNHIAALIQGDALLETVSRGAKVTLAVAAASSPTVILENGRIDPSWFTSMPAAGETLAFQRGGFIVALVRSGTLDAVALAAVPQADLDKRTRELFGYLLPVGIAAGAILIWAIIFLSRHQMALPQAIRSAVRHRQFFLVYQPIVDLRSGRWTGAEALIRWRRPNGEIISPEIFMPAAEESGLIRDITELLFQLIERDCGSLFQDFPDFHVSLNVSAMDIHDPAIVERLGRLKAASGAGDGNLLVEVTERGLTRPDQAISVIHELREQGIPVAVDDFGTGYSSLSYLESFDLDYLKIDKFFVDCIDSDGDAATGKVLQHIIELARSLGLQMIAEGVESDVQRDQLREYGVQFAQGWLYSKPLRMAQLKRELRSRRG